MTTNFPAILGYPTILDCTLRDGSYAIDFRFSAADTAQIAGALDEAAIPYIEVGHGIGLGASEAGKAVAAATDTEYMAAASAAVRNGKWGMFCIPGIATLDHLRLAADHGMDFVRVGTDITEVDTSRPFIELARTLGIEVFSNFMKSYASEPEEFGALVARSAQFGAELVYLVDSAGGMLPNEVRSYLQAARAHAPAVGLGFHGHNNLGLAVANSLVCVEQGAAMIDTSLQGFGRSAGNTPTEQFIGCLLRSGLGLPWDPLAIMDIGEHLIRPLVERRGMSSLDVVAGQALFHSSYMPEVLALAERHRIDPRALIVEICKVDRVNLPTDVAEDLAARLSRTESPPRAMSWPRYYGGEQ
jgi:4-hydroxy-2-oxovalerate aldolase